MTFLEQLEKNAYNKGHADGVAQGMNDAWELARNILDIMRLHKLDDVFGYDYAKGVMDNFTPQEAYAKLKAYEEAQNLRLGEIVIVNIPDEKGIVIVKCQDGEYKVLMEDFDIVKLPASKLTKIGKFVALNNILEQIGE